MSTCCMQEIVLLCQMDGSIMYTLLESMYFLYRYTQYGLSHKTQSRFRKGFNGTWWLFYYYLIQRFGIHIVLNTCDFFFN